MKQLSYTAMINQIQHVLRALDGKKTYTKREVIDVAVKHFTAKYPGFNSNAFILSCCSTMIND